MNPYSHLPDHHFWRRAVANVDRQDFDPVTATKFSIGREDRIATAGSCFAQHISRKLDEIGFNYFVTEPGAELPEAERSARNYRVFSARYGNIYTTRQLVQLFDEAFHGRVPDERAWRRPDGRFVDPYRPMVEPAGFADATAVSAAREEHLACVRTLFERAEIFVFTLGLTETWLSRQDGSVFPLAPGVAGGAFDETRHSFANLTVGEVEQDLRRFLDAVKLVNPALKILLTVSPVPLLATYEDRNVLVSTTYSKAVLRVAADTIARSYPWVDYFPSYEIITGSYNHGQYYCEDGREVNNLGVGHAMRVFIRHYAAERQHTPSVTCAMDGSLSAPAATSSIVCDEEAIAQITI